MLHAFLKKGVFKTGYQFTFRSTTIISLPTKKYPVVWVLYESSNLGNLVIKLNFSAVLEHIPRWIAGPVTHWDLFIIKILRWLTARVTNIEKQLHLQNINELKRVKQDLLTGLCLWLLLCFSVIFGLSIPHSLFIYTLYSIHIYCESFDPLFLLSFHFCILFLYHRSFLVKVNMFQEGSFMNMHSHTRLSAWTTKEGDINIPAHALHSGSGWKHTHTHTHRHRQNPYINNKTIDKATDDTLLLKCSLTNTWRCPGVWSRNKMLWQDSFGV